MSQGVWVCGHSLNPQTQHRSTGSTPCPTTRQGLLDGRPVGVEVAPQRLLSLTWRVPEGSRDWPLNFDVAALDAAAEPPVDGPTRVPELSGQQPGGGAGQGGVPPLLLQAPPTGLREGLLQPRLKYSVRHPPDSAPTGRPMLTIPLLSRGRESVACACALT